jgi:hypothetical protein
MVYNANIVQQGGCRLRCAVQGFKATRFFVNGQRVSRAVYDHLDVLADARDAFYTRSCTGKGGSTYHQHGYSVRYKT